MTVGEAARAARVNAGLTQKDLEAISGVNHQTISRIEQDFTVRLNTVELLADALGISIDTYVGHTVHKKPENETFSYKAVY